MPTTYKQYIVKDSDLQPKRKRNAVETSKCEKKNRTCLTLYQTKKTLE